MTIELKHQEGLQFLMDIPDNSVDLILTDPPYITSRDSGMDRWVDHIQNQDAKGSANLKTEEDWKNYKTETEWDAWFERSGIKPKFRKKRLENDPHDPRPLNVLSVCQMTEGNLRTTFCTS